MTPLVGVVGAYGAVGTSVAAALATTHRLRVGGRDPARLAAFSGFHGVEAVVVDVDDPEQVDRFSRGCDVVVNCAGPSCRVGYAVAAGALAADAAYIDVGGDEPMRRGLAGAARPAVLTAGLSPGLTGLLPRWLAGLLRTPAVRLRAWCGGLERFTPAAAADMVASLDDGYGESMAAWRDGALVRRALPPLTDAVVPPFPGRVSAYPYVSTETQRVAADLGLVDVQWYNVFAGHHALTTLNRMRADPRGTDPVAAAGLLVAAADLDLAGLRPYQLLVFELSSATECQTLTLRAEDGYRLTAMVAVAAVDLVLRGAVPDGAHLADEILDPAEVVAQLEADPGYGVLQVTPEPVTAAVEEGVL